MKPELNQTQAIYPLEDPKPKVCVTTTIAFLGTMGRSYGTIKNHISSVKHFHRLFGHPPGGIIHMSSSLGYTGVRGSLG